MSSGSRQHARSRCSPWAGAAALAAGGAGVELAGHWEGRIDTPGTPLHIRVDLERDGEGWRGMIDIPAQGAQGLPLSDIEVRDPDADTPRVEFGIGGVPGQPRFRGRLKDDVITGRFEQGGASIGFRLGREADGLRRPQAPEPGTLTVPSSSRPHDASTRPTGVPVYRGAVSAASPPGGRKREGLSPAWAETASAGSGRRSRLARISHQGP